MNTGIYEIKNSVNGKWYRGQTIDDFNSRWYQHKIKLKTGTHGNPHLQSSWNKYGEGAFEFTILSRCAPEFCNELEEYWIGEDYNNPAVSFNKKAGGFNAAHSEETKQKMSESHLGKFKGADNPFYGKQHTEESKQKMSEAKKGKYKGANHSQSKPFTVAFPDGRVDSWGSTIEASAEYGLKYKVIWQYLSGKRTPGKHPRSTHLKDTVWTYIKQN
jgi:group I intron endonuclease